jgi:hypothetical protein
MSQLSAPTFLYICNFGSVSQLVWDKVVKDISQNPATVVEYRIFKTENPAGIGFGSPIAVVNSKDPYNDVDVSWTDYAASENALYRVCAWDGALLGLCTDGYGIPSSGSVPIIPSAGRWDEGLWDLDLWGA